MDAPPMAVPTPRVVCSATELPGLLFLQGRRDPGWLAGCSYGISRSASAPQGHEMESRYAAGQQDPQRPTTMTGGQAAPEEEARWRRFGGSTGQLARGRTQMESMVRRGARRSRSMPRGACNAQGRTQPDSGLWRSRQSRPNPQAGATGTSPSLHRYQPSGADAGSERRHAAP